MQFDLAVIGAGNMAEAIVRGVLAARLYEAQRIIAADIAAPRRELFRQLGARVTADSAEAARQAPIVLLSVKPQQMQQVLAALRPAIAAETLLISIAAGKSTAFIERALDLARPCRIVRAMPNTPMLVGEGMVALCAGRFAHAEDLQTARRIFESAATVIEVPEEMMDAVTAISGSGPAYFFFLVEQMIRAAQEMGLSAADAHILATRTAAGAAKMLVAGGDSPAELRRKVTSPGGTTQAAIEAMESAGVPAAIVAALHRACQRSRELGS